MGASGRVLAELPAYKAADGSNEKPAVTERKDSGNGARILPMIDGAQIQVGLQGTEGISTSGS